jgi:DNA ligase (NAD+)
LYALGIRHIGEEVARRVARHFCTWENLSRQNWDELIAKKQEVRKEKARTKKNNEAAVPDPMLGLGEEMLSSLKTFFASEGNTEIVRRLFAHGVTVKSEVESAQAGKGKLEGKSFLFTGEMDTLNRHEAERLVISNGGVVASGVRKSLSYLVVGRNPSSKLDKAQKIGVPTIGEDEFRSLLE